MATTYGNVETTVRNSIQNRNDEIHTIIWTIPEFMNITTISSPIEASNTGPNSNFQVEISRQYTKHTQFCINYKSKKPVFVKSVKVKAFTFDLDKWAFSEIEEIIIFKELRAVGIDSSWKHLDWLQVCEGYKDLGIKIVNRNTICLFRNNSLRLTYEFVVTKNIHETKIVIPASCLNNDIENLFKEGMLSDIVMKSSDNKEFRVHKALLASRSAVLKAHFKHKFTENTSNIVQTHLESAVLREVLSYIYTDKAAVDKMPEKMLAAADYYQLDRLKSLCEDFLLKKLTKENAAKTLQLAELHNCNTLKQLTLEFIKRYGINNNM